MHAESAMVAAASAERWVMVTRPVKPWAVKARRKHPRSNCGNSAWSSEGLLVH